MKSQLNNLSPEDFWREFELSPEAQLLDTRTDEERKLGVFPDAIHINFFDDSFWDQFEALDKEKTYFVFCRTGRKSLRVCTYMKNSAFTHIHNLDGGLDDMLYQKMASLSNPISKS